MEQKAKKQPWNQTFLDAVKAAVVIHSSDTQIVACNKMAEELLGLPKDQMIGKVAKDPVWNFLRETGNALPVEEYPVNQVISRQEPLQDSVIGIRRPDKKEPVWVLVNAEPLSNMSVEIYEVAVTFMDITERKKAEEALRESEQLFGNVFESMQEGVLALNSNFRYTHWNKSMEEISHTPREEVLGRIPWEKFPFLKSGIEKGIKKAMDGGVAREIELKYALSNGKEGWTTESYFPLRDADSKVVGVVGLIQDITQRKHAEEALRESEKQFRTIIDTALEGIWTTDKDGCTTYVNQRILDLLGYSADELLGKNISDFLEDDDTEKFEAKEKLRREGYSNQYDLRFRRKDESELCGIVAATPLFDSEGHVTGGFSMVTDVTDRKRAVDEKIELEARLQRAKKLEAIGTLAGGVAHDLNNVLSGLVSYPDLLLMDLPADSPLRGAVLTIKDSGKRAAAIVQDLLTLARRGVSSAEVVNLNDVVREYLISPEFEKLKIYNPDAQIETDLQGDLSNVQGSMVHLSKTVMNLVSNAVESLRDRGVVTITTRNQYIEKPIKGYDVVKEGDFVVLTVADNGIGIDQEDLEKIFEPFYTKKVMGRSGTGLGMAVVWGTVKDHNGYINLESSEGKGSKFDLYFPITRKAADKDESSSIRELKGDGEKILVVDDVLQIREIASVLLKKLGYSVDVVSSGEKAVEYMEKNSADLLILDMIMDQGIDGHDTYKKIVEHHPGQKAIIASGFSETDRVKKTQKLGAGLYVKKPYTLEKIGLAVKAELSR